IVDELMGMKFRISSKSFYQVNPVQTKHLYRKAIELAGLTGRERVLDAYCGTGTIGMIASQNAGEVVGVELNRDAVKDARKNAKANGVKNIDFICRDAGEYMVEASSRGEHFDVVIMDPPRSGSTKEFIDSVRKTRPDRVVYISCNPETLARDLKMLTRSYKVERIVPFDMFPFTSHTECIVSMSKK
ncbi:MAG: 23S rRNA (uracil(1939)-C(5))-methyltransferase RlmD, partial [Lachnospiraceae bacterium]|nr:23S rRNA (uracil(1939)-C(5))-methyltransferase RlmD [Lachnospiraceae bacterium]